MNRNILLHKIFRYNIYIPFYICGLYLEEFKKQIFQKHFSYLDIKTLKCFQSKYKTPTQKFSRCSSVITHSQTFHKKNDSNTQNKACLEFLWEIKWALCVFFLKKKTLYAQNYTTYISFCISIYRGLKLCYDNF